LTKSSVSTAEKDSRALVITENLLSTRRISLLCAMTTADEVLSYRLYPLAVKRVIPSPSSRSLKAKFFRFATSKKKFSALFPLCYNCYNRTKLAERHEPNELKIDINCRISRFTFNANFFHKANVKIQASDI
jgi:hypothetical protein